MPRPPLITAAERQALDDLTVRLRRVAVKNHAEGPTGPVPRPAPSGGGRPGHSRRPGRLLTLCLLLPLATFARCARAEDPSTDPRPPGPTFAAALPQAAEAAPVGEVPRMLLDEAPDTGVDYYAYTQFRPDLDAPLTACTPIPPGATPSAGEYLFQVVIVPSASALRQRPFTALAERPWAAVRAELRYTSDLGGLIRIADRLPLVEPLVGSAPVAPGALRAADNLWGHRPGGSYRGTPDWHEHGLRWFAPLVRAGQGRAASASPEAQEVALLRALCDADPVSERDADGFRLYRLQRLMHADAETPGDALRRLWVFFSPADRTDGHVGLLAALKDDASHNTGFSRALYLNGSPSETHRKLFTGFQSDVVRFLTASSEMPQTHGSAPSTTPLSPTARPDPNPYAGTIEPPPSSTLVPAGPVAAADAASGWSVAGWLLLGALIVGLAIATILYYMARKRPAWHSMTDRSPIEASDVMASVTSVDVIPETSPGPRAASSRLGRMPVEAPADRGPTPTLPTEPALAAAAAALEATTERLRAERDLNERRCAELERRLAALERHAKTVESLGQADLPQALALVTEDLRRQEQVLGELEVRYRDQEERTNRLDQGLGALSARLTTELDAAGLEARLGRFMEARRPIGPDATTSGRLDDLAVQVQTLADDLAGQARVRSAAAANGAETSARLDRLVAEFQGLAGDLDDLKQARSAAVPDGQALQLEQLAVRIATLEAAAVALPPAAQTPVAPDPAPVAADAESAVTAGALADLAARLQAAEVFRESAWGARTRFLDDPAALAAWLVADYLPPNLPLPILKSLDDWLAEHFADGVRLILPVAGSPFDSGTHERIETVTGSGGMLRSVLKLVRPGLRCQGEVRRKAEVVAS